MVADGKPASTFKYDEKVRQFSLAKQSVDEPAGALTLYPLMYQGAVHHYESSQGSQTKDTMLVVAG